MDNQNQALSHLRALYYLACADNDLSRPEAVFIENVAEHLGISLDQLGAFQPGEPKLVLPDREYKIYSLYHRLVLVILIDNKLDKNERTYCFNLGIRMGLHPNAVGEIIDFVETKGLADALPSDVMNIFRKYLS